jgi:serine/threonine-protein kinase HipA
MVGICLFVVNPRRPQSQAMLIHEAERSSQVATCIAGASSFLLGWEGAISIVNHKVRVVENEWQAVCDEANLSEMDRSLFWRRQFLNPFAFLNAPQGISVPLTG